MICPHKHIDELWRKDEVQAEEILAELDAECRVLTKLMESRI